MSTGRARAHIIGNLGQDPEMRFTQSGLASTRFSVAVNQRRRRDGEEDPPPDWYRVTCFGQLAENADQVLRKGLRVYVDGRLQIDKWTGNDGQERTTVEIIASDFLILTPRDLDQNSGDQSSRNQQDDDELDDLPF
jgi:single-strand DNA-binding protein